MILCCYCEKPAELVTGETLYPFRPELHELLFWRCAPCLAWVGVHRGTETPLGHLANAPLRSMRNRAHQVFDPLWRIKMELTGISKSQARGRAYTWLAEQMVMPTEDCHIALFGEAECWRTIEICAPYTRRLRLMQQTLMQRKEAA